MTDAERRKTEALTALLAEGRYLEAEGPAREFTERYPENAFGWKALGAAIGLQGRRAQSLPALERAAALSPGEAEAHFNLGDVLKHLGRPSGAEACYRRALEQKPDFAEAHGNLGNALTDLGRLDEAEACYRRALAIKPDFAEAHVNLGNTLRRLGRLSEAEASFRRSLAIAPDCAGAHNNLGITLKELGRPDEAQASYRLALEYDPDLSAAFYNLGLAVKDLGRLDEAADAFGRALEIDDALAEAHFNLGSVHRERGRLEEAEASCLRALAINRNSCEAWVVLGLTLRDLGRLDTSLACYRRALELNPESDFAWHLLGSLLDRVGRRDEALSCLERSIALNPDGADAFNTLGNMLLRAGQTERSLAMFRRAKQLRPFSSSPAMKDKVDFSVLLLDSPGPGSIPINYLIDKAPFDSHFCCVLPDAPQDLEVLRAKADVVINLIADADNGKEILPFVLDIVERLGRPTINHPRLILSTDRETVALRLAGIPLCRIPKTARLAGSALVGAAKSGGLEGFGWPLLVRLAGNHGGDDFEKLADWNAVADFVARRPEADYYLTQYADYRSADGFFRKYRFISVDGELLPYHLAIHDDWKVHHFRTDMANREWMRREEESFLREPRLVFDEPRLAALKAVAAASGLDYCGIDCALDGDGDLVVFETNACMLVHDEKDEIFAYKNPYIAAIKDAFQAKLARLAADGRP